VHTSGGLVYEFNVEPTALTGRVTDAFFEGRASLTLPRFVAAALA
jgi:hypothetical protein